MKKLILISLLMPNILFAGSLAKTNADLAKDCIRIKKHIEQLINFQKTDDCEIKLRMAEIYTDLAATQLIGNNRSDAKDYLKEATSNLTYAEILSCEKLQEITAVNAQVFTVIQEIS